MKRTILLTLLIFSIPFGMHAQQETRMTDRYKKAKNGKQSKEMFFPTANETQAVFPLLNAAENSSRMLQTTDGMEIYGCFSQDIYSLNISDPSNMSHEWKVSHFDYPMLNVITSAEYADGYYYVQGGWNSSGLSPYVFLKVNVATWTVERAFDIFDFFGYAVEEMAYDATTGTMYGIMPRENEDEDEEIDYSELVTINLSTGDPTSVTNTDTGRLILTLACDDNGQLYCIIIPGTRGGEAVLYKIDKSTAELTEVGSTGRQAGFAYQSMAFIEGRLYWAINGGVYNNYESTLVELNPSTGEVINDYGGIGPNGNRMFLGMFSPGIPLVSNVSPMKNEADVDVNTAITVEFRKDVTAGDLSTITIVPDPGNLSASLNGRILTITSDELLYNTTHTVTIPPTAIREFQSNYKWSFTTMLDITACNQPNGLTATTIDHESVELEWVERGAGISWDIKYSTKAGFNPETEGTLAKATTNPFTLTGLETSNFYYFAVRSDCGDSEYSEWSELASARTTANCFIPISEFPWTEGFEETYFTPDCWNSYILQGGECAQYNTGIWARDRSLTRTGDGTAIHSYCGNLQEGWLVTPMIAVPNDSKDYLLSFWSYNNLIGNYGNNGNKSGNNSVWVSTGSPDPSDGDYVEVWSAESVEDSVWEEALVALTQYAGEVIHIGFRYQGRSAHAWRIDDISIDIAEGTDAAVTAIKNPVTAPLLTNAEKVTVSIRNTGSGSISGFKMKLELDGKEIATETYTGDPISFLDVVDYTFKATVDLSAARSYVIKATVILPGDENPDNNAVTVEVENFGNFVVMGYQTSVSVCDVLFYDDAGTDDYLPSSDELQTVTIHPAIAGNRISIRFSELGIRERREVGGGYIAGDTLFVYEGSTASVENLLAALTGTYFGKNLPTFTSYADDGSLTFEFKKRSSDRDKGWIARIQCLPTYPVDLQITGISPGYVLESSTIIPKVDVLNAGLSDASGWTVRITDGNGYTSTKNGSSLPVGETLTVSMDELKVTKATTLTAIVTIDGDGNPDNNEMIRDIYYGYQTAYSINTNPSLPGYISIDLKDGTATMVMQGDFTEEKFPVGEDYDGNYIYRVYDDSSVEIIYPDGSYELLGSITGLSYQPSGLAYSWKTGADKDKWYTLGVIRFATSHYGAQLYMVDMTTLVATPVSTETIDLGAGYPRGLDLTDDGHLYFVSLASSELIKVEASTGKFTIVGPTGLTLSYGQDLAFDEVEKKLYTIAFNAIPTNPEAIFGTYDRKTGAFTEIHNYGRDHYATLCITKKPGDVSINDTRFDSDGCRIYPNPTNGPLNVVVSEKSAVSVIDISGRLIDVFEFEANAVNTIELPAGLYLIRAESRDKKSIQKLIVK